MALESVIIAGGGMAGFTAARQLREKGFTGKLVIVDPEGMPYDRPPLSKDYLLAKRDATQILLSAAEWFTENNVEVITAKVVELDADAHQHHVGFNFATVLELDGVHASFIDGDFGRDAGDDFYPVFAVHPMQSGSQHLAHSWNQWRVDWINQCHFCAELQCRRSNFRADQPGPDDR